MSKTTDLTKGNIVSVILKFYFPMLFSTMLQQLYTIADTTIVGRGLGDDKLAAVGNMSSISFLIFGFAMGLSNGFSVIIAKSFGAKEFSKLKKNIAASIELSLFFSVILTTLSLVFMRQLLLLMQTNDSILDDSLRYGYIVFGGLITTICYNLCSGILRALGDSKTPFYAIITSSVMNILLDYAFIFIFKTGVEGAAVATVLSQAVSTFICFLKLRTIDEIKLCKDNFLNCTSLFAELICNGLPMAFMNSITAIGCVVIQFFVNGMGVAYTSAYSCCNKYINLFIQPACTAGFAMSAFTSQNYGAKEFERIRSGLRVCLTISLITYLIFGSVMFFLPKQLARVMLSGDSAVKLVAEYFPISGSMMFAVDFLFVYRNGVQGMSHPVIPMVSGIAEMVLRVTVILSLIDITGFRATSYAEVAAWVGALLMNATAFYVVLRQHRTNHV